MLDPDEYVAFNEVKKANTFMKKWFYILLPQFIIVLSDLFLMLGANSRFIAQRLMTAIVKLLSLLQTTYSSLPPDSKNIIRVQDIASATFILQP